MNVSTKCVFALQIAENIDEVNDIEGFLPLLQECFISVFKGEAALQGPDAARAPFASHRDVASREEEKLKIVRAVDLLHQKGRRRHYAFFQSPNYFVHAALFIHELLNSLSGNSKEWFRDLQIKSLKACSSVLSVLSVDSVRKSLPGIASATVKYISRSRNGKDSAAVLLHAVALLHESLLLSLSSSSDPQWIRTTAAHLSHSLSVLDCTSLPALHLKERAVVKCRSLVADLLTAPVLSPTEDGPLFRLLVGSFLVLDNMHHLSQLSLAEEMEGSTTCDGRSDTPLAPAGFFPALQQIFRSEVLIRFIRETLAQLRGVSLLHAATTVLRLPFLRGTLTVCGRSREEYALLSSVIQKCVRLAGAEMNAEDLYTHRQPRRHPAGIVDEFLETLAHSLAELPTQSETDSSSEEETSPGEQATNFLLEDAQEVLADWDLYMIHPATVYVVGRVVAWQFKPIPLHLQQWFSSERSSFPYPQDFIECSVLEQLWSVIGLPHLWNIVHDQELCNAQQILHRRVMASVILRVLNLVAEDVLVYVGKEDGTEERGITKARSFDRLCVLTLYHIMEKAALPGFVHDTAMQCLEAYAVASGESDPLGFFTRISDYLVDEASRAVKHEYLRTCVTAVLIGAVKFLAHRVKRGPAAEKDMTTDAFDVDDASPLLQVVRRRLTPAAVVGALRRSRIEACNVTKSAEFMTVLVDIGVTTIPLALREQDEAGTRALLTLLRDAVDIAALLNFSSPLEKWREDEERQTTSSNAGVKQLQCAVLQCIHMLQTHALCTHANVALAVEVVLRGLTSLLTSSAAVAEELRSDTVPIHENDADEEPLQDTGLFNAQPIKVVEWPLSESTENGEEAIIQLPRTLLTVVYQTYMPLLALLKEPVAKFVTTASTLGQRSRIEQRKLLEVPITDALTSSLSGLHALLLLAEQFLQHRYVTEVLPGLLVWYERALLPSIPSPTETRTKQRVQEFMELLCTKCTENEKIDLMRRAVEDNVRSQRSKREAKESERATTVARAKESQRAGHQEDTLLTMDDLFICTEDRSDGAKRHEGEKTYTLSDYTA
eukprot:gene4322-3136_t